MNLALAFSMTVLASFYQRWQMIICLFHWSSTMSVASLSHLLCVVAVGNLLVMRAVCCWAWERCQQMLSKGGFFFVSVIVVGLDNGLFEGTAWGCFIQCECCDSSGASAVDFVWGLLGIASCFIWRDKFCSAQFNPKNQLLPLLPSPRWPICQVRLCYQFIVCHTVVAMFNMDSSRTNVCVF